MLAQAMRAGLWAFAIAGPFYPEAYQYFVYFTLACTTIALRLTQKEGNTEGHRNRVWHVQKPYAPLPEGATPRP